MKALNKNSILQVVAYVNDGKRNSIITIVNFPLNWEEYNSRIYTDDEIEEAMADMIEVVADAIIEKGRYVRRNLDITACWLC